MGCAICMGSLYILACNHKGQRMKNQEPPDIDCPVCSAKAGRHCIVTAAIDFNHKERLQLEEDAQHMLKEMGFHEDTH